MSGGRRMVETIACNRGCGRQIPARTGYPIYCSTCQADIDSGKSVYRSGLLIDLPDAIRRYDKYGEVTVAVYYYKGRPQHTDPADFPEVTWEGFTKHLLHNPDFPGSWHLWVFRKADEQGNGAGIAMDASYTASADHAHVKIKGGRLS